MENTALAKSNGNSQLSIEVITQKNMALAKEMVVGGRKLTDDQIRGRAAFAAQQGLDVISEVHTLTDREGRTMAHTMSINGLRRKNLEQLLPGMTVDLEFVEIPKEKMQKDWAYAFECRLRDGESYRQWQKRILEVGRTLREVMGSVDFNTLVQACGPAPITVGVGVVYISEVNGSIRDVSFNPIERCKKRAEVNARHHRFPTNAPVTDDDGTAIMVTPGESVDAVAGEPEQRPVNQTLAGVADVVQPTPEDAIPAEFAQAAQSLEEAREELHQAWPIPLDEAPVSYTIARTIKAKDGTFYIDLDNDTLEVYAKGIDKTLKENHQTPEERSETELKRDTIKSIKAARKVL